MPLTKHSLDRWSGLFILMLLAIAAWQSLSLWLSYNQIEVWRHDAAYYLPGYGDKLRTEGRWINYYLFDFLKGFNPFVSAALHLLCLGLFVLVCSHRVSRNLTFSLLITLLCLSSITLYIQLLWPVTTLPSFAILALATLAYRWLPTVVFFPVFGILFMGAMSNLYFFLPLLFIRDYLDPKTPAAAEFRSLSYRIILPWVGGYLVGYLVAAGIVFLETGQSGITLAAWREPTPVTGLASLFSNVERAGLYFASDLLTYLNILGWTAAIILLVLFCLSYYQRRQFFHLLLPLMVMPAIYVSTIPYGINLSFRTSTGIWLGLVFIFLVIPDIRRWERPVYAAATLAVLWLTCAYSQANLDWYRTSTNYYLRELLAVTPGNPGDYKELIVVSELRKYPQLEQRLNTELGLGPTVGILTMGTAPRWLAVAKQAGFRKTQLCTGQQQNDVCSAARATLAGSSATGPDSLYSTSSLPEGRLVIRLNTDFLRETPETP